MSTLRRVVVQLVGGLLLGLFIIVMWTHPWSGAASGGAGSGRVVRPTLMTDPLVIVSAVLVLLLTAIAASLIPARRAARIDPAITLREE